MKFLMIQNGGELDVRLIALMGASTKFTDDTKLGKFGTGLKYAISYFLRNEIKFRLFVGQEEVFFNLEKNEIGSNTFDEIYCNGKSMNITTHYGHQWASWEAIREIWSNAKDEGKQLYRKIDERGKIEGEANKTTFFIEMTKEIAEVFNNWSNYFLNNEIALFEDDNVAIYHNNEEYLRLYKNGILIEANKNYKSLFNYDLKHAELNELRQYRGYHNSDIGLALLNSSKDVISTLLTTIKGADEEKEDWLGEKVIGDLFEHKISWDYLTTDKAKVKKLFSGYLFLHPDSDVALSGRSIKVTASMFSMLQKSGLPCEKVNKQRGGCYGGGGIGYSDTAEVKYKEISLPELEERIKSILDKYLVKTQFIIASPKGSKFELVVTSKHIVFSSDLDVLSDKDLEATVVVSMFHTQQGSIYKAFKRLIKFIMSKPYFKDILFGKGDPNQ